MKSESIERLCSFRRGKYPLEARQGEAALKVRRDRGHDPRIPRHTPHLRGAPGRPGGVTVVSAAEGVAFIVLWFQYPFWTLRRPRADVCADVSLISNQPAA